MDENTLIQWVNNDYYLYRWFLASKLSMGKFIKKFKSEISKTIELQMR